MKNQLVLFTIFVLILSLIAAGLKRKSKGKVSDCSAWTVTPNTLKLTVNCKDKNGVNQANTFDFATTDNKTIKLTATRDKNGQLAVGTDCSVCTSITPITAPAVVIPSGNSTTTASTSSNTSHMKLTCTCSGNVTELKLKVDDIFKVDDNGALAKK
jgi:hypothetical protein